MKRFVFLSIGVLIAVLIFSTIGLAGSKRINVNPNKGSSSPTPTKTETSGEEKEVQIIATEYSFSPSTISIDKGDKIVITLRNTGKMPHNLVLESPNLATKTILRGQSDTIEFTATESGKTKFYSSVSNDRALGMEGNLEVR